MHCPPQFFTIFKFARVGFPVAFVAAVVVTILVQLARLHALELVARKGIIGDFEIANNTKDIFVVVPGITQKINSYDLFKTLRLSRLILLLQ